MMCKEKETVTDLEELLSTLYKRGEDEKVVTSLDIEGLELTHTFECKKLAFPIDHKSIYEICKRGESEFVIDLPVKTETIKFVKCDFLEDFKIKVKKHDFAINIEFIECTFNNIDLSNSSVISKLRFRKCTFQKINFNNTKFKDLADFWCCTFNEVTIFYKTDFLGTTVFSGSTFERNVLFTYSLIEKLIIFRGTNFKEGLDLSLAIIPGEISCFDIQISNFEHSKKISRLNPIAYEENYETSVSSLGEIPVINKRETFRILKQTLVKQDNISDSIKFKVLEKRALFREIIQKFEYKGILDFVKPRIIIQSINHVLEIVNLSFNAVSNWFGSSYGLAFAFTTVFGWLFFSLSIASLDAYPLELNPYNWDSEMLKFFPAFLIPTHKFDYLDMNITLTPSFYLFDFVGRLIVGYGFYQFIQAFRKYR